MATTSTVVPGGDLAGRSAEYRRGYVAGLAVAHVALWLAGGALAVWMVATGVSAARADRAEAQMAEMRARAATHAAIWHPIHGQSLNIGSMIIGGGTMGGTITLEPGTALLPPGAVNAGQGWFTTPHVEVR